MLDDQTASQSRDSLCSLFPYISSPLNWISRETNPSARDAKASTQDSSPRTQLGEPIEYGRERSRRICSCCFRRCVAPRPFLTAHELDASHSPTGMQSTLPAIGGDVLSETTDSHRLALSVLAARHRCPSAQLLCVRSNLGRLLALPSFGLYGRVDDPCRRIKQPDIG